MADEITPVVAVVDVKGGQQHAVDLSIAEGAGAKPEAGPNAESVGVTEEQFTKYFKDGVYNWEAHAKEGEFKAEQKAKEPVKEPVKEPGTADDQAVRDAATNAGLDFDALRDKVIETGDIAETDYEALAKIGIPQDIAEEYIDGVYAKAKTHFDEITGLFGGPEGLKSTMDTLVKNGVYTDDDREVLAAKLADPRDAKITANMLLQQAGMQPKTFRGANQADPSGGAVVGYQTQLEQVTDMRDPRYKKDAAFRATVLAKTRAATFEANPRGHSGGR